MPKIKLHQRGYITEGSQRLIYTHPDNPELCIKIPKEESNQRYVSREIKYTKKYQDKVSCIPAFHGTIHTDLGMGYVFDLVKNYDGSVSQTLRDYADGGADMTIIRQKIEQLYALFLEKHIIVSDLHAGNILVRHTTNSDYELWIVDGLGNSDFIKICDISYFFHKKKLMRKFTRFARGIGLDMVFE